MNHKPKLTEGNVNLTMFKVRISPRNEYFQVKSVNFPVPVSKALITKSCPFIWKVQILKSNSVSSTELVFNDRKQLWGLSENTSDGETKENWLLV